MAFEAIGQILDRSPARSPITPTLLALKVEKVAQRFLPTWAKMRSFREGRLIIGSPTSAHSQEIFLHSRQLAKKINEALGGKVVEEIRYRTTPEPSPA